MSQEITLATISKMLPPSLICIVTLYTLLKPPPFHLYLALFPIRPRPLCP